MSFAILPAIDVHRGRLARYTVSGPEPIEAFGGDPVAAAASFAGRGCEFLHLVDMGLAFDGTPTADEVVRAVLERCPNVEIQMSGGITTWEQVRGYLDAGATRVVVGSAALVDEAALTELLLRADGRALVGIEVEAGRIRSRGRVRIELELRSTLDRVTELRPAGFLVTAVDRVGAMQGPDVDLIRAVTASGVPTLAAGGIADLADLRGVRDAGGVGAVVGSSALDGRMDLARALAWAAGEARA